MNQMMSMHSGASLLDNDPFFNEMNLFYKQPQQPLLTHDSKQESNTPSTSTSTSLTNTSNNNNALSTSFNNQSWGMMKVDIHEEKDKFIISAELPGVDKNEVKVSVDNGYLTISGDKKEEKTESKEEHGRQIRRSERRYGEFSRSFRLPSTCDQDKIQAKFDNGVLSLNVPKVEKKQEEKTKHISIN